MVKLRAREQSNDGIITNRAPKQKNFYQLSYSLLGPQEIFHSMELGLFYVGRACAPA